MNETTVVWLPKRHCTFSTHPPPPSPPKFNDTPFPFSHALPLWPWWGQSSCTGSTRCWPRRRFWTSWRWIYTPYYPGCPSPPSTVWESPGFPPSPCPTGISGSSGDVATVGHSFKNKTKLKIELHIKPVQNGLQAQFTNNEEMVSERFISQMKSAFRETDDGHTSQKGLKDDKFGSSYHKPDSYGLHEYNMWEIQRMTEMTETVIKQRYSTEEMWRHLPR